MSGNKGFVLRITDNFEGCNGESSAQAEEGDRKGVVKKERRRNEPNEMDDKRQGW